MCNSYFMYLCQLLKILEYVNKSAKALATSAQHSSLHTTQELICEIPCMLIMIAITLILSVEALVLRSTAFAYDIREGLKQLLM